MASSYSAFLYIAVLQPRYLNEALLLMAKVHYVQGRYRDAQGMCARVGLEELTQDDQPTYHLRLLAEAFVIKGKKKMFFFPFSKSLIGWFLIAKKRKTNFEEKTKINTAGSPICCMCSRECVVFCACSLLSFN